MDAIHLRLPYPPSVNHYWSHTRNGTFVRKEGVQYRAAVMATVLAEFGTPPHTSDRIGLSVDLVMPDARRRDLGNVLKALCDAMEHAGMYLDDSQIDELHVVRRHIEPPGCADVIIQPLK